MSEQNKIIEFWSDIQNVKNASPEDIQSDILAYLKLIAEKDAEIERLTNSVEILQGESRRYAQVGAEVIEERDRLLAEIERKEKALQEIVNTEDLLTGGTAESMRNRAREAL